MEPKEIIERIDEVLAVLEGEAGAADACDMLIIVRNRIASDADLFCCDGCGEWVPMSDLSDIDLCKPCMECLSEREDAARDDAQSAAADARHEAERINRNLWSLGGGRAARLLLLAAWPVVEVMGR